MIFDHVQLFDHEIVKKQCEKSKIPRASASMCWKNNTDFVEFKDFGALVEPEPKYFMLASVSKLVTLLALKKLAVEGHLQLDWASIYDLNSLRMLGNFNDNKISVRDCINHRTGLQRTPYDWKPQNYTDTRSWLRDIAEQIPQSSDFSYAYSNLNYQILGACIEEILNTPFLKALPNIFKEYQSPFRRVEDISHFAALPHNIDQGEIMTLALPNGSTHYHPSASLFAKTTDLNRFFHLIFIKDFGFSLFKLCDEHAQSCNLDIPLEFGFGLFRGHRKTKGSRSLTIYGHGGKELGYNTLQIFAPEIQWSLTISCNARTLDTLTFGLKLFQSFISNHPSSTRK